MIDPTSTKERARSTEKKKPGDDDTTPDSLDSFLDTPTASL